MIGERTIEQVMMGSSGYRTMRERLHDEAGLDVYDDELMDLVISELIVVVEDRVEDLETSKDRRAGLVHAYKQRQREKASTAIEAVQAGA